MNSEQRAVIEELRNEGFAIVIFEPSELEDADPEHVQDRLTELGWDVIGMSK